MPQDATLILRAAFEGKPSIYRDIEIEASKSLYQLAEAIVAAFGFDFDHPFGFYSGLTDATMLNNLPQYELFADMGEADPGVLGVKKTRIAQAFPAVGHTMRFLFDYGDEWVFRVRVQRSARKVARVRYPRIVASRGEAPEQYPEVDDEDAPSYGINLATDEKFTIKRK